MLVDSCAEWGWPDTLQTIQGVTSLRGLIEGYGFQDVTLTTPTMPFWIFDGHQARVLFVQSQNPLSVQARSWPAWQVVIFSSAKE